MKKKMTPILILFVLLTAQLVSGSSQPAPESGFFGNLTFGPMGFSQRHPQSEVAGFTLFGIDPENRKISDFKSKSDSLNLLLPLVMGKIGYAFSETGTKIYIGSDGKSPVPGLNISQSFEKWGTMNASFRYQTGDVWKDPYLLDQNRSVTEESEFHFGFQYESIFNTGLSLSVSNEFSDVDAEHSGEMGHGLNDEEITRLKRDGVLTRFNGGYTFMLNQMNMLTPSLDFVIKNRDGESHSGTGYGFGLSHQLFLGKLFFSTTVKYLETEYDKPNPILLKTRKDQSASFLEVINYRGVFGYDQMSLVGTLGANVTESNITFFESEAYFLGFGVNYNF